MNHIPNLIWETVLQQDGLSTTAGLTDLFLTKKDLGDNNDLFALKKSQPPQSWEVNLHKVCLQNLLYS